MRSAGVTGGDRSRPSVTLVVSIDTEEDNWLPSRSGITVENIREIPGLHAFLSRLGVRPTYFATYAVGSCSWAAPILRGIEETRAGEVGAHLHPWNTPPLAEELGGPNTMLKNLPAELQLAKLEALTSRLTEAMGRRPTAFRAGRYGLGPQTVDVLVRCGYRVDSSVTPFTSWLRYDDGPDYNGAPLGPYSLASGQRDVRLPVPDGPLLELPVSCGYSRVPYGRWHTVYRLLSSRVLRPFRLHAIAARTGLLRRIMLSPEGASAAEMLTLARSLIAMGTMLLHCTWHSPSLRPGLGPFVRTHDDVARLYACVERLIETLDHTAELRFMTVSEAAAAWAAERQGDVPA